MEFIVEDKYYSHAHDKNQSTGEIVSPGKLAPLTECECLVLDDIKSDADRYTVYSTPGRLAWGVGLKVGEAVLAQLPNKSGHSEIQFSTAIIRSIGVDDKSKLFGVEIVVCIMGNMLLTVTAHYTFL